MEDESASPQLEDFPLAMKLEQVLDHIKGKETEASAEKRTLLMSLK